MQSQQKKVKWSRGETADALEERTDTGITQVSVSRLENIIADVYGNISRRPALKIIENTSTTEIPFLAGNPSIGPESFARAPQSFVFTINADTYIIFIKEWLTGVFGGMLIHQNKFIKKVKINNQTGMSALYSTDDAPISATQYNNFMVVANLYEKDVILRLTDTNDISVELFQFSAPWYAPEGAKTTQVSDADIVGLRFDASSVGQYTYTEDNGITTVYSWIKTGLSATGSFSAAYSGQTVSYYLHKTGSRYFYDTNPAGKVAGPFTITNGQTYTSGDQIGNTFSIDEPYWENNLKTLIDIRIDSVYLKMTFPLQNALTEIPKEGFNISTPSIADIITPGSIVQFPNNGAYMRVEGYDTDGTNLRMYGSFLTPIANDTAIDTIVKVEYGYVSLSTYNPTKLVFSNQRLYVSRFYNADESQKLIPGYVVGSQIGRYNDFKNDYNMSNEAITIDISTAYQEQVVAMADYNGLKIFTDSAEYSYSNGGIIKQSENGSLTMCNPLVVGSVCVYADKSGHQLRAMQYELQSDLFTSSSINQMAQEDLIFNTSSLASFLDKEHFAGRFLYATQFKYNDYQPVSEHSLAVCNFVPGNQAMIWSRWTTPDINPANYGNTRRHTVSAVVEVNNKVWFIVAAKQVVGTDQTYTYSGYTVAELDYNNRLDFESTATTADTKYQIIQSVNNTNLYAWVDQNDETNIVYTESSDVLQGDNIYDGDGNILTTADNSPGGPNIIINGVGYYQWGTGGSKVYTKSSEPEPTGTPDDPSRELYDENGDLLATQMVYSYNSLDNSINMGLKPTGGMPVPVYTVFRVFSTSTLDYTIDNVQYNADPTPSKNRYVEYVTMPNTTVSVFDGDEYKWDDVTDIEGKLTKSLSALTNPHIGFKINAILESHPMDIGGKTYTEKKRIGKAVAVIRNTEPGAFTVCNKTGYTSVDKKTVNFYGCTGMKDLVRYTITNIQGAKFTIESLTMIIEYGTLDS